MDEQLSLGDYLHIARRRWKLLVATFLLLLGGAVIATVAWPPIYQASGLILVESQQIPDELIKSTITSYADERIALIQQRVMTRENLLRIIDKFKLFAEDRNRVPTSELIEEMRESITVAIVDTDASGRRHQGKLTIAFRVGFDHNRPEVALRVANELVTLFLDENVKTRTERAEQTTEFLTQEAKKLKTDLEKIEADLAAYKQKNADALPEHLDLHLKMLERSETEYKDAAREIKALEEEKRFLEIELAAVKSGAGGGSRELSQARSELAEARGKYSPDHPDIKYLERKVSSLQSQGGGGSRSGALGVDAARVQGKIAAADTRIDSYESQRETLKKRIAELEEIVVRTPQVERGLQTLSRDYENAVKKYQELKDKQLEAQFAENLEVERKAERFSILEPPVLPDTPIKPNRKKMLATGIVLAFAGSGGSFLLVESLDQTLRGPQSLSNLIKQAPLVRIPYLETRGEANRRRRRVVWVILALLLLAAAALAAVHFFYLPLDILWAKVLVRIG
jgi:polysaccharide chain length determinant protein (PEP-CTERM system associated)